MRTLHPGLLHGAGLQRSRHRILPEEAQTSGPQFVQGDAQDLAFPDESFDAVINVEASHIYPDFERFLVKSRACCVPADISSIPISAIVTPSSNGKRH